jgi:3-oxoacyl-[acyl-carrier protein] reductase
VIERSGCALVTGASRGIGAATARVLAQAGWPVGVLYRDDAAGAQAVAAELGADRAVAIRADVATAGDVDAAFAAVEDAFGVPVLVLVNNAGVRADALAAAMSDDAWSRVLDVNLGGAFLTTRRAMRAMLRARFGRVVNISSVIALRANAGQANYAASKAGLIAMTRTVAVEVARKGVTVNAVAPGYIDTALIDDVPEERRLAVPAGRAGTAEEVAACVGFLASEQASYVTGATLVVDGGLTA